MKANARSIKGVLRLAHAARRAIRAIPILFLVLVLLLPMAQSALARRGDDSVPGGIAPAAPTPVDPEADTEGGRILIGQSVQGTISDNWDADTFQFAGLAGESVRIEVEATDGPLVPAVTLFLAGQATGSASPAAATAARGPVWPSSRFSEGDVFCAVGYGKVKRFSPDGRLLQTLDSGSGSKENSGMSFDATGSLYNAQFHGNSVYKFDINGNLIGSLAAAMISTPSRSP